ncbi:hypothetical protein pb186bvf_014118 [Paramecium bursaria]
MSRSHTEISEEKKAPRWEYLYKLSVEIKEKRKLQEEEKKQKDDQLDPECTFAPKFLVPSKTLEDPFLQRQIKWTEEKNKKVSDKKKQLDIDKDELKECTFKPTISVIQKEEEESEDQQKKRLQYQEKFVKRQQQGHQQKKDKEQMLQNPYSHLSGEKKTPLKTHIITSQYESHKNAERIEFKKAVQNEQQDKSKIQLGDAIKLLHNQLHNIKFGDD